MTVTINIACDNAAFTDDAGTEINRILQDLVKEIKRGEIGIGDHMNLRDINGNKVGECSVNE